MLRNAKFNNQTNRWDTPLRKLIEKMAEYCINCLE